MMIYLHFLALTPHLVTTEDITAHVEEAIRTLPVDDAEEANSEMCRILKSLKPPCSNLTAIEKQLLLGLNTDKIIVALPADNVTAPVIMKIE